MPRAPTLTAPALAPFAGRSIPQRYAHAQTELAAAKQVWARRSELPLSEVRAPRECRARVTCRSARACSPPHLLPRPRARSPPRLRPRPRSPRRCTPLPLRAFAPQVAVYGAFGAELFAFFCVGEIVGRGGSLTEYSY
jgi:hypothetical protein